MQHKGLLPARIAIVKVIVMLAFILSFLVLFLAHTTPSLALSGINSLSPSNGYVGTSVTLVGTIDTSNGAFRVRWETTTGTILQSGTASGTNVIAYFAIPTAARGTYNVFLEDATTGFSSASTFTVNPLITISPTSSTAGTVVIVTGTGFAASETGITITWDTTIPVATGITANAQGGWSSSFTAVPASATGTHTVDAYGISTSAVSVPDVAFNLIVPQITLSPTSGAVGSSISVSAGSFFPNETGIAVTYDGVTVASGIRASSGGSWTATFTIPESASGVAHTVDAYGTETPTANVADRTFNVTPKIFLNSSSGAVGTTVTVTATGFRTNETNIAITYEGAVVKSGITASALGSWSGSFVVPDSASGNRAVDAYGDSTLATSVPDVSFIPTPSIMVSPAYGAPGTAVTVTGTGFAASESSIAVTSGGTVVKDGISASNKGSWNMTFVVPASAGGSRMVGAYGSMTSASRVPEVVFTVMAKVTVNLASGIVGTQVTVTGISFGVNESGITLIYDGAVLASGLNANANGGWNTTFAIPVSVTGSHIVSAYGNITPPKGVVETYFSVTPDTSVNPTSGFVGTAITITGRGFAASKTITITYDGTALSTNPSSPTTSAQGSFDVTFTAPRSKGGGHKIQVTDETSSRDADWSMDSIPPAAPNVTSSTPGQIKGIFGDVPVSFHWPEVTDPSGVYYSLQVDTRPDFTTPFINEEGLTSISFTSGKLALGTYYWHVKTVDGAYNESAWSATSVVKVGLIPLWAFMIIIAIGFLVMVGVIMRFLRRHHRSEPGLKPNASQNLSSK
jgi:hypothetical protein